MRTPVDISTVSQMDLARMAMAIDCEGTITIRRQEPRVRVSKSVVHSVMLQVPNTDVRLVNWCKGLFGGSISAKRPAKPHHKPSFNWIAWDRQAEAVIRACRPYLIMKGDRADIALALRATVTNENRCGNGRLPINVVNIRESLRNEVMRLNKRGVEVANG